MKRLPGLIAAALFAAFGYSQDLGDIGNLGGDVNSLLNIPAPRGNAPPGNRGAAGRGGQPNAPGIDRLGGLRQLLASANAPLKTNQEAAINALINSELPAMRSALQARADEMRQLAAPSNPDELVPVLNRLNDQLVGKIASAPILSAEQQSVVRKAWKEQVRSHGGFEAISLTMEEANVPFTAEQASQIRSLFDEENRARVQMIRELQG